MGPDWHLPEDLEAAALARANEFKVFYEANGKIPVQVAQTAAKRQKASPAQLIEQSLASWLSDMKKTKKGTGGGVCYPSVDRLLSELMGPDWHIVAKTSWPQNKAQVELPLAEQPAAAAAEPAVTVTKREPKAKTSVPAQVAAKPARCGPKAMTRVPPGPPQAASAASAAGPSAAPQLSPISLLHQKYKSMRSDNLAALFQAQPALWHEYHDIADANEASFPPDEVPYRRVAARLRAYFERIPAGKPKTIVDLGCGRARLCGLFADRPSLTFINIDHVAAGTHVTVGDIAHTGLEAGAADVAVLCLALWGSNCDEYFAEAHRILDPSGRIIVVEPGERWRDAETGVSAADLYATLLMHGFEVVHEDVMAGERELRFALFEARKA